MKDVEIFDRIKSIGDKICFDFEVSIREEFANRIKRGVCEIRDGEYFWHVPGIHFTVVADVKEWHKKYGGRKNKK